MTALKTAIDFEEMAIGSKSCTAAELQAAVSTGKRIVIFDSDASGNDDIFFLDNDETLDGIEGGIVAHFDLENNHFESADCNPPKWSLDILTNDDLEERWPLEEADFQNLDLISIPTLSPVLDLQITSRGVRRNWRIRTGEFGTVKFNGLQYVLQQQAYANNWGTDGGVRYYAAAVDPEGGDVEVAWDTTAEWDSAAEGDEMLDDESNACDWDNPVEVIKL